MAAYGLLLIVLNGGVSDATLQWGAAAYARGDRAHMLDICRRCAGYHMLVEAPLAALTAATLLRRETFWTIAIGALAAAIVMIVGTTVVMLSAMGRNASLAKLNLIAGFAAQLGIVTVALQSHAAGPTWAARLALTVLVPVAALFLTPRDLLQASFSPRLPRRWPAGFASYSVRTLVATLVGTLVFSRCELLVLDAYGDTAGAGLFALAAGLASQITAPIDAMLGPLIPAAASLVAVGREHAVRAILRGLRLSALMTIPVAVVAVPTVAMFTPIIYGSQFALAGALFISLGLVSCLQSVLHPASAFVGALRKPLVVLGLNACALAVDLSLVVALVPSFGAAGAVAANTAGQLVAMATPAWLLRRQLGLGVRVTIAALLPFIVVAIWTAGVSTVAVAVRGGGLNPVAVVVLAIIVGLVGSVSIVRALGGVVTGDDLTAVESTFPRRGSQGARLLGRLGMVRRERSLNAAGRVAEPNDDEPA